MKTHYAHDAHVLLLSYWCKADRLLHVEIDIIRKVERIEVVLNHVRVETKYWLDIRMEVQVEWVLAWKVVHGLLLVVDDCLHGGTIVTPELHLHLGGLCLQCCCSSRSISISSSISCWLLQKVRYVTSNVVVLCNLPARPPLCWRSPSAYTMLVEMQMPWSCCFEGVE